MSDSIALPQEVGEGKDREARVLLDDRSRKLVAITVRRGAILADHAARVPITIQTLVGRGVLGIGSEKYELSPGVLVPLDAHVVHSVQGQPDVTILVSFFRGGESTSGDDTTARFT